MFKVGDFVYFKNISMCPEMDDRYGYGTILEIKDLPKYLGSDEMDTYAVIQVKYLEDGTPYEFNFREVVKLQMLDPAEVAVERQGKELQRQLDNMKHIRKEFINEIK